VSTLSQALPVPYCAVYQGAVTIADLTTFIDDTFLGSGDTSSVISGTVVHYGEGIIAKWTGGNPGDTAVLTIYGVSTDVPPSIEGMPGIPGTRFAGRPTTEIVSTISRITTPQALGSGSVTTLNFDMRQFASYYFNINAQVSGVPTGYNPIEITPRFGADSNIPFNLQSPTSLVFPDTYEYYAAASAPFIFGGGPLTINDVVHGPWLNLQILNNGPDTVNYTYLLMGTTRLLPGPYARQEGPSPGVSGMDGILLFQGGNIPGAGVFTFPALFGYGETYVKFSTGANGLNFSWNFGSSGLFDFRGVAANSAIREFYNFPKRAALVSVAGPVGTAYGMNIIEGFSLQ
jgi:hypothetical protein